MSSTETFTVESNPADFNGGPVETYLATADRAEVERVLAAETGEGGKDRVGVKNAATDRLSTLDSQESTTQPSSDPEPTGLAATGNPNDMATGHTSTAPASSVSADVEHQDGAPEAMTKAADKAAEVGYIGTPVQKPDYSQANPAVMNQD